MQVVIILSALLGAVMMLGLAVTLPASRPPAPLMFAECSLVTLGVNALLFFTPLLEKTSARSLLGAGLILALVGLAVLAQHRSSDAWMYLGVSLTAAGTGLVLPVISYLAAAGPSGLVVGFSRRIHPSKNRRFTLLARKCVIWSAT